ncbi:MAG: ThiF family adenylyltransferase [Spirochaetaceae bacterium]|nr:ThiF family adenylyltransferase [Spirochaetaceae bacterium]
MSVPTSLSLSGDQYEHLRKFLFPGDGKEAVALLLCGRRAGDRRERLVVREVQGIPYDRCSERTGARVTWPPEYMAPMLDRAAEERLSVVKVHSHPSGCTTFSATDDEGDARLLPMIRGWVEADIAHGSVVMLPNGVMFGRVLRSGGSLEPIDCIAVAGDDLRFWYADSGGEGVPDFAASHAQLFGEGTIERMRRLSIAVVGASGTGSPVIEQLQRLNVGELVVVDDDHMEERNVIRVLNSTMQDADEKRLKVDVQADAINQVGLGTRVIRIGRNLWDPKVVRTVAQCDVLFGCMDSVDGRYLLNSLASYYTLPYFDIGVRLQAVPSGPRKGRIREVCGTVNYVRPGRSSLMSRGLFTMSDVAAAGLRRNDPDAHTQQVKDGYIRGAAVQRPAVISVNMFAASLAVNEFLARLHPFREEPNGTWAAVEFSLASMELYGDPDEGICELTAGDVGKGDVKPLLGLLELAERRMA